VRSGRAGPCFGEPHFAVACALFAEDTLWPFPFFPRPKARENSPRRISPGGWGFVFFFSLLVTSAVSSLQRISNAGKTLHPQGSIAATNPLPCQCPSRPFFKKGLAPARVIFSVTPTFSNVRIPAGGCVSVGQGGQALPYSYNIQLPQRFVKSCFPLLVATTHYFLSIGTLLRSFCSSPSTPP